MKTARQYRERANFLRKMAEDANLAALRDSYLSLARDWDHMADMTEGVHAGSVTKAAEADG